MTLRQFLFGLARRTTEQRVETPVRHRQPRAVVKILLAQAKRPVRFHIDQTIPDQTGVLGLPVWGQAHQLVLAGVHPEAGVVSKCRVQQSQRMREMNLPQHLQLLPLPQRHRSRGPFPHPVHGQDHGFIERRGIIRAGRVTEVMLCEEEALFPSALAP